MYDIGSNVEEERLGIITFSGAAGGTVSADSIGYFELRVFGSLGQVTATATNGMETVRRATTLH